MRTTFTKTALTLCAVYVVVFGGEAALEWWHAGSPGLSATSWVDVNNAKLVDILSPMARGYNNALAMLIATIGLAIPLTANMHTPKLIDMFLRDRLNQGMLFLMALGAANVLFVDYLIGPHFAPMWAFRFAVGGALLGWALVIPYFFYVVRFLDPSNILRRLKDDTTRIIDEVLAGRLEPNDAQAQVHERLFQIGTIVLKSLDRADRGVALEGIWTLKLILDYHGERKAKLPAQWFVVDRADFIGLSSEALELLNEEKTWFEMKALTQMFLAYGQALAKAPDVVSSISDANRVIAVTASKRGDPKALELSVKYFNNFLREAIKKKDVHSIYDIFYEYRLLARDLRDQPGLLHDIAHHFRYYSDLARAGGLEFVAQLATFDLGYIVRRAYEVESPTAGSLLKTVLDIGHEQKGAVLPLVVKAKLILGGFFLEKGLTEEAKIVRENLADVAQSVLATAEHELLSASRSFFEVTDRQVNFEYTAPERREHVHEFVHSLAPAAG